MAKVELRALAKRLIKEVRVNPPTVDYLAREHRDKK
jgi:hypothetical protein